LIPVAVAVSGWYFGATTGIHCTWAVANAARIGLPHTRVNVIADAILIGIRSACSAAYANSIGLVAIAIAVPCRDIGTTALIDGAWTVANATGIQASEAFVFIIANAIAIRIGHAVAATIAQGIVLIAIAVAVPRWDIAASAFQYGSRSPTDSTGICGQAFCRCEVIEVAGGDIGTAVLGVAQAVAIGVVAVRDADQPNVVEIRALTVGVRSGHDPELHDVAAVDIQGPHLKGAKVIDHVEELLCGAIDHRLKPNKIGVFPIAGLGEVDGSLQFGEA
jgi:hypothetical protein